jgi:hypothetical protein
LTRAGNSVPALGKLWQPNNNDAVSAVRPGASRLTHQANWGQIAPVGRDLRIFRAGAFAFGNGLHARRIAAFAGTKNRDRGRARAACRDFGRACCRHVIRAGAITVANTHSDAFADAKPDTDRDQLDGVVGRGGDESR